MAIYTRKVTCKCCGLVETKASNIYGDFDGWEPEDLVMEPEGCSFCNHLVEMKPEELKRIQEELKRHF